MRQVNSLNHTRWECKYHKTVQLIFLGLMLYSQEKKLLFIHVQKTGGASFGHILKSNITDTKSALRQHANAIEAKQYLGNAWDEYYKVAFVRSPWDRLVSWYSMISQFGVKLSWHEKILKSYGNERYNKIWQYVLSNSSSFEEFIHNCSEATSRAGWKPFLFNQIDYLTDGNGRIFIDTLENMKISNAMLQLYFSR